MAFLVLAGGQGKRMKSSSPKVLQRVAGRALISHVLSSINAVQPEHICIVTGHQREQVEESVRLEAAINSLQVKQLSFAFQPEQRGTGDAVRYGLECLKNFVGTIIIMYGDMPLIGSDTLHRLIQDHTSKRATISLLTCSSARVLPYGRIVRGHKTHHIESIVEAKDCSSQQFDIREYNVGVYAVDSAFLAPAIESLTNDNAQKEYYLTDIVSKAAREGQLVHSVPLFDEDELLGVNDLYDLHVAETAMNKRRIRDFILSGVTFVDEKSVWIDPSVTIEPGAHIGPNVQLRGMCTIASNVVIEGSCLLVDTKVGKGSQIKLGVRTERSEIGPACMVGPFAHLREGSMLGSDVKIGNFVETKKASLAAGAKASHLSYLGDCQIGEDSNIGAGTITCNYDGIQKHQTNIGKNCFIGSDSVLIAPLTIGDGAYIGAGSAISKDIESGALAFTRPALVTKAGWAARRSASIKSRPKGKK